MLTRTAVLMAGLVGFSANARLPDKFSSKDAEEMVRSAALNVNDNATKENLEALRQSLVKAQSIGDLKAIGKAEKYTEKDLRYFGKYVQEAANCEIGYYNGPLLVHSEMYPDKGEPSAEYLAQKLATCPKAATSVRTAPALIPAPSIKPTGTGQ